MDIVFPYKPFPVHMGFHLTAAREKCALGAVASGKTIALCADAIMLAVQQPGSKILVCRMTIPSLRDTTEMEFLNLLQMRPEDDENSNALTLFDLCEMRRSGGHVSQVSFPNGSEVLFKSLDDWRKLMGENLCGIYVDEASEIPYETYLALKSRLRQKKALPAAVKQGYRTTPKQVLAICANPAGHNWVWEHFTKAVADDPSLRLKRRLFHSTSFDNPTLYDENGEPDEYLKDLLTMPEIWVQRMVLGSEDAFAGQIYSFNPEHHVHNHFVPPDSWERAMGLDWGLRNPTAIVWWARNPESRKWYMYREWQSYDPTDPNARDAAVTPTVHQIADTIKRLEKNEKIRWRAIDPACAARQAETGKSVMYWFSQHGLHFQKGMKRYEPRINALGQMFDNNLLSVADTCSMSMVAIQQYRWEDLSPTSKNDGPERPQKKNDHLVNACEYLATLFMAPQPESKPKKPHTFNDEIWSAVRKQIAGRR